MRKLLIIAGLMGIIFVAAAKDKKKKKDKKDKEVAAVSDTSYTKIGSKMPPLRLVTYPGKKVLTDADFANDATLLVFMFNPTCGHCQDETFLLQKHMDLFKKTKIAFLASPNMGEMMEFFETTTKVSQYPKIQVGLDSSDFIIKTFHYEGLPQINIYDKDRRLVKVFTGDTPMDSLKKYIE